MAQAVIYAIREAESGLLKIGLCRTKHLTINKRIPAIRRDRVKAKSRPSTLSLIVWADWPPSAEMLLHRYLWETWIEGEWFSDSEKLQQCVRWMHSGFEFNTFLKHFKGVEHTLPKPWPLLGRNRAMEKHRKSVPLVA